MLLAWRNSILLDKNLFTARHPKTFLWTPKNKTFSKINSNSTLHRRCSVKKVVLKASQHSQENTCAEVSFLKGASNTSVFFLSLRIFQDIYLVEHLRTTASAWIFSRTVKKVQKIFKSTSEKMLLVYIIHNAIPKGSS